MVAALNEVRDPFEDKAKLKKVIEERLDWTVSGGRAGIVIASISFSLEINTKEIRTGSWAHHLAGLARSSIGSEALITQIRPSPKPIVLPDGALTHVNCFRFALGTYDDGTYR